MRTYLILLFILLTMKGFGQTTPVGQIDKELQLCLDSAQNYSTAAMSNCILKATEKWDKLLNQNYKELLSLLPAEQKVKLKESQRKWIEFRDKEIELSNQLYALLEGTMWIPVMHGTRLNLTKQRTLQLQAYIDNLKMKED